MPKRPATVSFILPSATLAPLTLRVITAGPRVLSLVIKVDFDGGFARWERLVAFHHGMFLEVVVVEDRDAVLDVEIGGAAGSAMRMAP